MDPSDVVGLIIEKLQSEDGPAPISVVQSFDRKDSHLMLTPVVKNGHSSFNIRVSHHFEGLRTAEGVNFENAEMAAEFMASHSRAVYTPDNRVHLRFVHTQNPTPGFTHLTFEICGGNEALVCVLKTVVAMRQL